MRRPPSGWNAAVQSLSSVPPPADGSPFGGRASVFASFRDCSHFFHTHAPPVGIRGAAGASLKSICQRFRDKARYATMYDGDRRLALYSAYESQAVLEDYTDAIGYERGPLNPDQHQAEPDDKSSTYTLTNAVPQSTDFLDTSWNPYLDVVRRRLNNFCHGRSYVVTGVTVSTSGTGLALWREKRQRVAIPKHLWLAYCCPWFDRNSPHK
ncbi:hypothetical protein CRUP_024056, partial [Coryphaenoides rupestris]